MISDKINPANPGSNTGLNSQIPFTVKIDWLDLTFRKLDGVDNARQIIKDIEVLTTDEIDFNPHVATFNGHQWDGSGRGAKGAIIWYQRRHSDEKNHTVPAQLKICIPGKLLDQTDMDSLALWLNTIANHFEPECTRLDIALDDYEKVVSLDDVIAARRGGHFFNVQYTSEIISGSRGEPEGRTIYFGSPASSKRLRIYDKAIESGGLIDANRWEAQFRGKASDNVFHIWLDFANRAPEALPRILQNYVLGLVDFRDRDDDDPNRHRCEPLAWYVKLCEMLRAEPARVLVKAVVQSVQRSIDWVIKAVAPSLFTLKSVLSDDFPGFMASVIDNGATRLSNKRRKAMNNADKQQLDY